MIDGRTQLVGTLGWPVEQSLSPIMHNAAFSALLLDWSYVPFPLRSGQIEDTISGLVALGFRGANVTIPYKEAVIPFLHRLSPEARGIGAVNTIVIEKDGILVGHNTDSSGIITTLQHGGFDPKERSAVVCGAGGAARAAVHGLLAAGTKRIALLNRTLARAEKLICAFVDERLKAGRLSPETLMEATGDADLLINATSVGMWPHVDESIWPSDALIPVRLTVFDLMYNPVETLLLKRTRSGGARAISGLETPFNREPQHSRSGTGENVPIGAMRTSLKEGVS